ncbi:MAG: hypothetical protein WBX25_19040 [Rhodomicrobium sp.]
MSLHVRSGVLLEEQPHGRAAWFVNHTLMSVEQHKARIVYAREIVGQHVQRHFAEPTISASAMDGEKTVTRRRKRRLAAHLADQITFINPSK